jgi:hypothetical protein
LKLSMKYLLDQGTWAVPNFQLVAGFAPWVNLSGSP